LPFYFGLAAKTEDPLERMKFVVTYAISSLYLQDSGESYFQKALDPILGETFNSSFNDGTEISAELISHLPPISYILGVGPDNSFVYSAYYMERISSKLNSSKF